MSRAISLVAISGILIQVLIGIISPLKQFQNEFWQDPLRHNEAAYGAENFAEFKKKVSIQSQPLLEYAFRRYIVFPILGFSERSLRLPDWFFWILTVIALPVFTYFGLGVIKSEDKSLRFLGSLGVVLWFSKNPTLLTYAVEGRHYAWCAFFSLVWTFALLKKEALPSWCFHLASFFYISSHFFVWPLVGFFYAADAWSSIRSKNVKSTVKHVCMGLAIFGLAFVINFSAAKFLWVKPPGAKLVDSPFNLLDVTENINTILFRFFDTFRVGMMAVPAIAFLWFRSQKQLGLSLLVMLCVFFLLTIKSNYPINPRYFIPFTGIAWLIGLGFTAYICELLKNARKSRFLMGMISILALGYVCYDGIVLVRQASHLQLPQKNFTDLYSLFRDFEKQKKPILILSAAGSETTTLSFYTKYLRTNDVGIDLVRASSALAEKKRLLLARMYPDSRSFLFGVSQPCKESNGLKKVYFTKDTWMRCLFEIPPEISPTELEQIIQKIEKK